MRKEHKIIRSLMVSASALVLPWFFVWVYHHVDESYKSVAGMQGCVLSAILIIFSVHCFCEVADHEE